MKKLLQLLLLLLLCSACATAQQRPVLGPFTVVSPSSGATPFAVQGTASQTGNLAEFKDSSGAVRAYVKADGTISATFTVSGAEPQKFLYTTSAGAIASIAPAIYDPLTSQIGFFTSDPQASFHVNAPSLFTDRVNAPGMERGAFTVGQQTIEPVTWNRSTMRFGTLLPSAGDGTSDSANEFGIAVQVKATSSGTTVPYEKAGIIIFAQTEDPSNYGTGSSRDVVGIDSRGGILSPVVTGRVWGGYFEGDVASGADGNVVAAEFGLYNLGTDQPLVDTVTSKTGISVVAGEGSTVAGTNAISISGGAATWHRGIWSRQDVFTTPNTSNDSFIELMKTGSTTTDMFRVKPTGQTIFGDLSHNADLGDYDPTVYGVATIGGYASVVGSGGTLASEKHVLYLFSDVGTSKHRIGTTRYNNTVSPWGLTVETLNSTSGLSQEVMYATVEPFVQLTTSFASATPTSAAGTTAIRNNAGVLEVSNSGSAWTAVGVGTIGGVGTASYLTKWIGPATIANTSMPLFEYNGGAGNYSMILGTTSVSDPGQQKFAVVDDPAISSTTNHGALSLIRNPNTSTLAYAAFVARSGAEASTNDMTIGVTSSGFSTADSLLASMGFIKSGASASGGLITQSYGPIRWSMYNDVTLAQAYVAEFERVTDAAGTGRVVNFEIGTLGFDYHSPIVSYRAQNDATYILSENNSNGTLGSTGFRAYQLDGVGNPDFYVGVTAAGYTTANGITARTAFAVANAAATGGMQLQALGGPIVFLPNGSSEAARFDTSLNLLVGQATADDATQGVTETFRSQNTGTWNLVRNSSTGTAGYAAVVARSGAAASTLDLTMGATSSGFSSTAGLVASIGFIKTGASATGGLTIQTAAGPLIFEIAGITEKARFASAGNLLISLTSTDVTGADLVTKNAIVAATATTDASTFSFSVVAATYASLNAGRTGAGTRLDMAFFTGGAEAARLDVTQNLLIGVTTADDATQGLVEAVRTSTTGTWNLVRNSSTGTTAYAGQVARSGAAASTNDITMGVTSSGFTPTTGLNASQGFVRTGASATNGLALETATGATYFVTNDSTIATHYYYSYSTQIGTIAGASGEFDLCYVACGGGGITLKSTSVDIFGSSAGAPSAPASGVYRFYVDTNDGNKLKVIGASSTVTTIAVP